jgi:hypothetical protein
MAEIATIIEDDEERATDPKYYRNLRIFCWDKTHQMAEALEKRWYELHKEITEPASSKE